jgi:hypothetical protein
LRKAGGDPGSHDAVAGRAVVQRVNGKIGKRYKVFKKHVLSGTKLRHRRSQTSYGAFQPQGRTSQNGPHIGSHVTNQVALERVLHDIDSEPSKAKKQQILSSLQGTRLAPTPRQLLSLQKKVFSKQDWAKQKVRAKKYHNRNKRLYRNFADSSAPLAKRQRALGQYVEAHPLQTYDQGLVVPHAHIKGKGENRKTALSQAEGIVDGSEDVADSLDPHALAFIPKKLHKKISKRQRQIARRTVEDNAALSDESEPEVDSDDEF